MRADPRDIPESPDGLKLLASLIDELRTSGDLGCAWFASMSSHLWKYVGSLSEGGKTMTLSCERPSMTKDGETALYRDVTEFIDTSHRRMKSNFRYDNGVWQPMVTVNYTRA